MPFSQLLPFLFINNTFFRAFQRIARALIFATFNYLCTMKKRTIWTIAAIMAVTFGALIWTQVRYFNEIVHARQEQFDENMGRILFITARNIELEDTRDAIEQEVLETEDEHIRQANTELLNLQDSINKLALNSKDFRNFNIKQTIDRELHDEDMRQRVTNQKELLNRAIYAILYAPNDKPVEERIDFNALDNTIQQHLKRNGMDVKYHFSVTTVDGRELYRCPDYEDPAGAKVYSQNVFANEPADRQAVIRIHFPQMRQYLYATARFVMPALLFTFILLIIFIYTIWQIFRQKRLTEMKNDFVNNMTHELKTPISTISLAAQMLSDPVISKNENSLRRFSGVIADETKRLRFLVDKVLQTSLFERGKAATFKMDELDANTTIEDVASTFTVKVHNVGGTIDTQLDAEDPIICADQMHFTNVIFNLLDNAYKYRRQDAKNPDGTPVNLHLTIRTANENNHLKIYISDNGIGIRHDELKNIFKKFYRVHTGDRHDVKGFGLGLAYVSSVVEAHKGRITAESTYGQGTTFIITLPLMES